ncbi:MAG: hypothetical protein ACFB6R_16825 [Alphaproteobacteria bacterium]
MAVAMALMLLCAVPMPGALAQPAGPGTVGQRSSLGEDGDPALDALVSDISCRNGAGHRITDWGLAPRIRLTPGGVLVYRWLEYGAIGNGSGWTVMYARARLSDLTLEGMTTEHSAGDCPAVEAFCKVEGCVTVQIGPRWASPGARIPDRNASVLVIHTRSQEAGTRLMRRLSDLIAP